MAEQVDVVIPDDNEVAEAGVTAEKKKRQRRVVNRDTVKQSIADILALIEKEIDVVKNRSDTSKATGVRFLKSLKKRTSVLATDYVRALKQKPPSNRKPNSDSGFLKPVPITEEMGAFVGAKPGELRSRVQITKNLCDYIKLNNLQKPEDRRFIIPNPALKTLLRYDPKKFGSLTYYTLQKCIQIHFPPQPKKAELAAAAKLELAAKLAAATKSIETEVSFDAN